MLDWENINGKDFVFNSEYGDDWYEVVCQECYATSTGYEPIVEDWAHAHRCPPTNKIIIRSEWVDDFEARDRGWTVKLPNGVTKGFWSWKEAMAFAQEAAL